MTMQPSITDPSPPPNIRRADAFVLGSFLRFISHAFDISGTPHRRAWRTQFVEYQATILRVSCCCALVSSTPAYSLARASSRSEFSALKAAFQANASRRLETVLLAP